MALSIRARLTLWYSALLLLALGSFIAVVLVVHWRLLVNQYRRVAGHAQHDGGQRHR